MSMLKNNYTDKYICFSFNSIKSEDKKVYIQNSIDDLKLYTNKNASIDYTSPKYQNGRYVMGVTRSHLEIPLKLVTAPRSRLELYEIEQWLAAGTIGDLIFDFAPEWKYRVIVNSISDFNLYVAGHEDSFIASFDVKMHTIGSVDAINTYPCFYDNNKEVSGLEHDNKINNIPVIKVIDNNNNTYTCQILHMGNGPTYVNFTGYTTENDSEFGFNITVNNQEYKYSFKTTQIGYRPYVISYNSLSNLFLFNNHIAEHAILQGYVDKDSVILELPNESLILYPSKGLTQIYNMDEWNEFIKNPPIERYFWFSIPEDEDAEDEDTQLEIVYYDVSSQQAKCNCDCEECATDTSNVYELIEPESEVYTPTNEDFPICVGVYSEFEFSYTNLTNYNISIEQHNNVI